MDRSTGSPFLLGLNLCRGKPDPAPASSASSVSSKARNIYRQPHSATSGHYRGRSNSCGHFLSENRRRQCMLYDTWRTSLSDGAIRETTTSGTNDPELEVDEDYRPRAVSTGAHEGTKLKPDNLLTRLAALRRGKKSPTKHTSFCDQVSVHYYDGESQVRDTCEKLKSEQFISSVNLEPPLRVDAIAAIDATTDATNDANDTNDATDSVHKLTVTDTNSHSDTGTIQHPVTDTKNDAIFLDQKIQVLTGKTMKQKEDKVRISIKISPSCVHKKTCVKATSSGKTILVMAYKEEQSNGKPLLHQFVRKLSLPHEVDPYGIRALTYNTGNLVIEAPIFHRTS